MKIKTVWVILCKRFLFSPPTQYIRCCFRRVLYPLSIFLPQQSTLWIEKPVLSWLILNQRVRSYLQVVQSYKACFAFHPRMYYLLLGNPVQTLFIFSTKQYIRCCFKRVNNRFHLSSLTKFVVNGKAHINANAFYFLPQPSIFVAVSCNISNEYIRSNIEALVDDD